MRAKNAQKYTKYSLRFLTRLPKKLLDLLFALIQSDVPLRSLISSAI